MSAAPDIGVGRDLRPLFDPRSVAILGASDDPAKWGNWLARDALRGAHRRRVVLVNRRGGRVLGEQAHRSLADVGEPVELVVVAVPAAGFEQAIDDALAASARAIVAISAGLGELGEDGAARERAAVERVRAAGAVLLGPNCLGVFDAAAELELGANEFLAGAIGLVSQSGNLALELGRIAARYGLGFSRFASLGNQADLEAWELVADLAEHAGTRVIALYLEDFRDGRTFARTAQAAVGAGTPVVLLTAGRSEAGAGAARSHTGALVSDHAAVEAACRAAGILRVSTPRELVDVAQALLARARPRGRRLAIVGDGGGHCALAADVASAHGLDLPPLPSALRSELACSLPPTAVTRNPVDLAGGGEQDFATFERVTRAVLATGEVDAVLLTGYFGGYSQHSEDFAARETAVARAMVAASASTDRCLVVHSMYPDSPPAVALRAGGVAVYAEIEAAVLALARLADQEALTRRGVPAVPDPATPLPRPVEAGYVEARGLLAAAGVPFVPARSARTAEEAVAAAGELGYPVVLKALGLLHKSDSGGVALAIRDERALTGALASMDARLAPPGYAIEQMAPLEEGLELIAGCRWDPRFGPVALVGLGGLYAELLGDVATALAPVSELEAEALLRSLRGFPLLAGARGRPPVDLEAAAAAIARVSELGAAHPELAEVEVNPLLVTRDGALALDARVVASPQKGDEDAR